MPRKNPAAVSLGRRGGKVRSAAKTAAARRNALTSASRRLRYRLLPSGALQRRDAEGAWQVLSAPLDEPAKAFLRRHRA